MKMIRSFTVDLMALCCNYTTASLFSYKDELQLTAPDFLNRYNTDPARPIPKISHPCLYRSIFLSIPTVSFYFTKRTTTSWEVVSANRVLRKTTGVTTHMTKCLGGHLRIKFTTFTKGLALSLLQRLCRPRDSKVDSSDRATVKRAVSARKPENDETASPVRFYSSKSITENSILLLQVWDAFQGVLVAWLSEGVSRANWDCALDCCSSIAS